MHRPTLVICVFLFAHLATFAAEAQVADMVFDDTAGSYNAVANLTNSINDGSRHSESKATFSQVPLNTTRGPQAHSDVTTHGSFTRSIGTVTRAQADPSSTYSVTPEIFAQVVAGDTDAKKSTIYTMKITANYSDHFYLTDTGSATKTLGITFTPNPNAKKFFPVGSNVYSPNIEGFSLEFEPPDTKVQETIDVSALFGVGPQRQFNIEFDKFGPDNLYRMHMELLLESNVNGLDGNISLELGANLSNSGGFNTRPIATIEISDPIPGVLTRRFGSVVGTPGPQPVPTPAAAVAGLTLLGLLVTRRRRVA